MIVPHHGYCGGQFNQENDIHNINDRSLSTGHANSTKDMLSRLETMVLSGADLPIPVVRQQIGSAIDIFVHLSRLRDRSRRVMEITEVCGLFDGEVVLNPLYVFEETEERAGKILGRLARRGSLLHTDKLRMAGIMPNEERAERVNAKGEQA